MTIRTVTPASGAAQITIAWEGSPGGPPCNTTLTAGQVLDVPVGGPLETAIGLANLTTLSAAAQTANVTGSDPLATANT